MSRPPELPGIWGLLAEALGVAGLADQLGISRRTLYNWANGLTPVSAVEAGMVAHLCEDHGITPLLYLHRELPTSYITSCPEGWVIWPAVTQGWRQRRRYLGYLMGLVPATKGGLLSARTHGWPW